MVGDLILNFIMQFLESSARSATNESKLLVHPIERPAMSGKACTLSMYAYILAAWWPCLCDITDCVGDITGCVALPTVFF